MNINTLWRQFKKRFESQPFVHCSEEWRTDVTHLVTTCSTQQPVIYKGKRSAKYFKALLNGAHIVCKEWMQQCTETGHLIQLQGYYVKEARGWGPHDFSRNGVRKRPFENVQFLVLKRIGAKKADVLKYGGGVVINDHEDIDHENFLSISVYNKRPDFECGRTIDCYRIIANDVLRTIVQNEKINEQWLIENATIGYARIVFIHASSKDTEMSQYYRHMMSRVMKWSEYVCVVNVYNYIFSCLLFCIQ